MPAPRPDMTLVFADEFDRTDFYDQAFWDTSFFYGGRTIPTLYQKQFFIDRDYVTASGGMPGIDPFAIDGGVLSITADRTPTELLPELERRPYTGGLLSSFNGFSFQYGYVEIRAQMPAGKGLWPAFWLLRTDSGALGEIDIAEILGQSTTTANSTIHYSNDGITQVSNEVVRSTVTDLSVGFHTYGLDWTDKTITFSIDGVVTGSVTTPDALKATMYLLANLSVGGLWAGDPNADTPFPSSVLIDWIRVWQDADRTSTAAPRSLSGTAGNDTFAGGDARDTILGLDGNDTFGGGAGDDSLSGGAGKDRISGDAGADTIDGGAGADYMLGGRGDDLYIVDDPGDIVWEAEGGGNDRVLVSAAAFRLSKNPLGGAVETVIFTGTGDVELYGSGYANRLVGGAGNDMLDGGIGADTLEGGAGDDIYIADDPVDRIVETAGGGFDTIRTTNSVRTLAENVEALIFELDAASKGTGNELGNLIVGNAGADSLLGLAGNDTLWGRGGTDTLVGGIGDDVYVVDDLGDRAVEGSGAGLDAVHTSLGAYTLAGNVETLISAGTGAFRGVGNGLANVIVGSEGADVLAGGAGHDTIHGGAGNDKLSGGLGNDRLVAGSGYDTVNGDEGADVFVFAAGAGPSATLVNDFRHAEGDRLDMRGLGLADFAAVRSALSADGLGQAVITAGDEKVTLKGVAPGSLVESDFLFGPAPENLAPTGLTLPQRRIAENSAVGTPVSVLIGTDPDAGEALSYALLDDAGGLFAIRGRTLVVNGALDHEAAKARSVTIRVTDEAGGTFDRTLDLLVTDANEAPFGLALSANVLPAGSKPGTTVGLLTVKDPDLGDAPILSLSANPGGRFTITDGKLVVIGPLDAPSFDVGVTATDFGGLTTQKTFTITVEGYWAGGPGNVVTGTAEADLITPVRTLPGALYPTAGPDTIDGRDGDDTLDGGGGDDLLIGGDGNDSLLGGDGNDRLEGGPGIDTLIGGTGDDVYVVGQGDILSEAAGAGRDEVRTDLAAWTLAGNLDDLVFTGSVAARGVGNGLANTITGTAANDTLIGGAGDDRLFGSAGNDRLNGGTGNDTLEGGAGTDTLTGDAGADVFVFADAGAPSRSVLSDFVVAEDRVDLRGSGLTTYAEVAALLSTDASGYAVLTVGNETMVFQRVAAASLGEAVFIL